MKRRTLFVGFVVLVILAGTAACLLTYAWPERPGGKVSITLLGYTNDVTGSLVFDYATTNVAHSGFAVFSAHNPTRSHFACFLTSILLRQAGTGEADVIPLKAALHSAQTSKTSLIEDFQLPPGATVRFAVPMPNAHGTWQSFLSLNRVFLYKTHPWQTETVMFAQRLGLHFGEKGQLVSSRQITQ